MAAGKIQWAAHKGWPGIMQRTGVPGQPVGALDRRKLLRLPSHGKLNNALLRAGNETTA